ncbi:glycosyltransferase [Enterococcus hailinensis]|uniref:glycosyltransferase n=1 Tax=Enterococcus hailinensis TaxID=3238988 RepID=UPI0038B34446
MIFVTVGTHEQQFDRLISEVDKLVNEGLITEEVVIQTGYCTYVPKYCKYQKFFSYTEMEKFIQSANIVICHGGPSTFMSVVNSGKVPIVVPRLVEFNEHVNNHQLDFAYKVKGKEYCIEVVKDITTLNMIISNVSLIAIKDKNIRKSSNNIDFLKEFTKLIKKV